MLPFVVDFSCYLAAIAPPLPHGTGCFQLAKSMLTGKEMSYSLDVPKVTAQHTGDLIVQVLAYSALPEISINDSDKPTVIPAQLS